MSTGCDVSLIDELLGCGFMAEENLNPILTYPLGFSGGINISFLEKLLRCGSADEEDVKILNIAALEGHPGQIETQDIFEFQRNMSVFIPEDIYNDIKKYFDLRRIAFFRSKQWRGVDDICKEYGSQEFDDWHHTAAQIHVLALCGNASRIVEIMEKSKLYFLYNAGVSALGNMGAKEHADVIAKLVKDNYRDDKWVRRPGIEALVKMGAKEFLAEIVKDENVDSWVREAGMAALGRMGALEEPGESGDIHF